jgi:hypothetical protein
MRKRGHGDEFLRRECAQTVEQFLRCCHAQALKLVGGLRPGLHRGATGRPQGPDHLHAAVTALGHARGFVGQHRSCGALGVGGVGLLDVTARACLPAFRALYLQHLDPPGPQVAGESGPVATGAFYLLVPSIPAHLKGPKPSAQQRSPS